jgi:hypothetical protein
MKDRKMLVLVLFSVLALSVTNASAQSSGNFAAKIETAACVVNSSTGALSGGTTVTVLDTSIKTPNSNGTALVIRPSLVTGLFTKSKSTATDPIAAAVAGVRVRVLLDGEIVAPGIGFGAPPTDGSLGADPDDGNPDNDGWVYYDKRFQLLSTNLFNAIVDPACDDLATPEVEGCFIELVVSTLSAHSIDFVAPSVGGGIHPVKVEWQLDPSAANQAACVGPGVLTVQQVKTFSQSGGIIIQ